VEQVEDAATRVDQQTIFPPDFQVDVLGYPKK
jgi:hypothetical protein